MDTSKTDFKGIPILILMQRIKDGTIDPKVLPKSMRQECVETLLYEGFGVLQIAQLLSRDEKTIRRDIKELYEQNAPTADYEFTKSLIGEYIMRVRSSCAYLMRLARSKDGSICEKAQAELYSIRTFDLLINRLQSIGYLPQQPQVIENFILGQFGEAGADKFKEKLNNDLIDVENASKDMGIISEETIKTIKEVKDSLNTPLKKENE